MQLNLYSISDEYVKYLRRFDNRVYSNKEKTRKHTRKYIGTVLNINGFNYYIPLSSPKDNDYYDKERTKIRKSIIPIIRVTESKQNGILKLDGTLRVSNMIPVPITEIIPYLISEEKDEKYRDLILAEIRFIRKNTKLIVKYANILYKQKDKNQDIPYIKNTLDFKLLEEKCLKFYNKWNNIKRLSKTDNLLIFLFGLKMWNTTIK